MPFGYTKWQDAFHFVIILATAICGALSVHQFFLIPSTREDHGSRKTALLILGIVTIVELIAALCVEFIRRRGDGLEYGRRKFCDILLCVAFVLTTIGLLVGGILLLIQIEAFTFPDAKSVIEECGRTAKLNVTGGESEGTDEYCKSVLENAETLKPLEPLPFCDEIFALNSITTGTGKSRTTKFRDDKAYCVTTNGYWCNIGADISAFVLCLSNLVLIGIILMNMKAGRTSRNNYGSDNADYAGATAPMATYSK